VVAAGNGIQTEHGDVNKESAANQDAAQDNAGNQ
jgi:hypothetical protein